MHYTVIIMYDICMSPKSIVFLGMAVGSLIGGYLPVFFGASVFSYTSLLGNVLGGLLGIYITYKTTQDW